MNKVRASAVGRSPERQLRDAWERYGPASAVNAFLPADRRGQRRRTARRVALLEAAPESELRRAIAELVCAPVQRNRQILCIFFHSDAPG